MTPEIKQTIKDALANFEDSVRTLSRLYSENEELNDIQPAGEEFKSDFHGHVMCSDAADIYPHSLDEWTDQIQIFVEKFGINLDYFCPDKRPFDFKTLREQLGEKVGDYLVETCPMSGSIGILVGDRTVYATPDWDGCSIRNELLVQVSLPDGDPDVELSETYVFDYHAPLNDMVTAWKDILLKHIKRIP